MSEVIDKAKRAKQAAFSLGQLSTTAKNAVLLAMAEALVSHADEIIAANTRDGERAQKNGMSVALQDRLRLDRNRIQAMADGVRTVAALPDPAGAVLAEFTRPNGLQMQKIAVPMGVIAMIYESRPNVTADAAALCLKAGSAVVLRGGSDALESNIAIVRVLRAAITKLLTPEAIQLIESPERSLAHELMTANGLIDLLIPRGGAGLIQKVLEEATIPVIETGVGNCHVYIDAAADIAQAYPIVINAKTQRPSVCNAAESLLVHVAVVVHRAH